MNNLIRNIKDFPQVYELDFKIRSYEIDFRGYLNPVTLFFMLQEAASSHASTASADIYDLMKKNKTWMLSRLRVVVNKYPRWKDEIRIFTWPVKVHRLFAIRDFLITDSTYNVLAKSTSSWLVIDLKRRKPVKVDEYINRMYLKPDFRAINQFLDRPDIPVLRYEDSGKGMVKLADIDINGHMTSMKYIEKIVDNFDESTKKENYLKELLIYFKAEALLNDQLIFYIAKGVGKDEFFHKIVREKDEKELCVAKTVWEKLK